MESVEMMEKQRTSLLLGENNRFFHIVSDELSYDYPLQKVNKFKKHLGMANDIAFLPEKYSPSEENIIVSDKENEAIRIFDEDGKYLRKLNKVCRPLGIATTAGGMIAMVDSKKGKERVVRVLSSQNGGEFSKIGVEMNWKPYGVAFNNKGQLVISEVTKEKHSVGIYTLDGRQLVTFGTLGSMAQNFNKPLYLAVDMFDRIIVSDRDNHSVKLFDDRGVYLGKIGGYGSGVGRLKSPRGVCCDSRANILICDSGNRRVCVYSPDGRYIQDLLTKSDHIGYPFAIAYSKNSHQVIVSQHTAPSDTGHLRKVQMYKLDDLPPLKLRRIYFK